MTNNVIKWKACGSRLCYMRLHAVLVAISLICTDTDHKPVISDINLKPKTYAKKAKAVRCNSGSLHKPNVAEKFKDILHEKFEAAEGSRDGKVVEAQWSKLKTILHEAAEQYLGKTEKRRNQWISKATIDLIKKRARACNWSKSLIYEKWLEKQCEETTLLTTTISSKR